MSRTDQQRYNEALNYLKSIDLDLGNDVDLKLGGQSTVVGAEISLRGAGYWQSGSATQHTAVRALLLCQIAYFRKPHCRADVADRTVLNATRAEYLGKSLAEVNAEIKTYTRPVARSLRDVARAAENADQPGGDLNFVKYKRTDRHLGMNIICYNGTTVWLFISGFASKRWLAGPGNKIDANNADIAFGRGQVIQPDQWDKIPEGYLWSIQRKNDPTTCHWGISLGDGSAAGTNNTPGSLVLMLDFQKGGTLYGTYEFVQMCEVLNSDFKYGNLTKEKPAEPDTNIVVKQINPARSNALF